MRKGLYRFYPINETFKDNKYKASLSPGSHLFSSACLPTLRQFQNLCTSSKERLLELIWCVQSFNKGKHLPLDFADNTERNPHNMWQSDSINKQSHSSQYSLVQ